MRQRYIMHRKTTTGPEYYAGGREGPKWVRDIQEATIVNHLSTAEILTSMFGAEPMQVDVGVREPLAEGYTPLPGEWVHVDGKGTGMVLEVDNNNGDGAKAGLVAWVAFPPDSGHASDWFLMGKVHRLTQVKARALSVAEALEEPMYPQDIGGEK